MHEFFHCSYYRRRNVNNWGAIAVYTYRNLNSWLINFYWFFLITRNRPKNDTDNGAAKWKALSFLFWTKHYFIFFVHILIITLSFGTDIKADRFWIEHYNNRIYRARLRGGHLKRRAPDRYQKAYQNIFWTSGWLDAESLTILISSQEFDLPECGTVSLCDRGQVG